MKTILKDVSEGVSDKRYSHCPSCDQLVTIKDGKSKCNSEECGAETDWTEKINEPMKIGVN